MPRPRTHSPRPRWSSSAMARGVSPSPHALSRGKTAASARTTSRPSRAAHAAAADPAGPAPTTRTSVVSGLGTTPSVPGRRRRSAEEREAPCAVAQIRPSATRTGPRNPSDLRAPGTHLLHRRHGVAQLAEPLLRVLADEADRPDERLGPRPRD